MSRAFLDTELGTVATFWRIMRRDGVALGFTTHDRALWFAGVLHRAAPGMVPGAIRRTAGLRSDDAEVRGVLSHDAIRSDELRAGRYDDAAIVIGAVDWETRAHIDLYHGTLGSLVEEDNAFAAELRSSKMVLERDYVPRTSPTCRVKFCGPGCNLSAARHSLEVEVLSVDPTQNAVRVPAVNAQDYVHGGLRWIDGPHVGLRFGIVGHVGDSLILDTPICANTAPGTRAILGEGCDHTIATCTARFGNAANFRGEPFLPGNDLLTRYPLPS